LSLNHTNGSLFQAERAARLIVSFVWFVDEQDSAHGAL